jgi:hypothetical protein
MAALPVEPLPVAQRPVELLPVALRLLPVKPLPVPVAPGSARRPVEQLPVEPLPASVEPQLSRSRCRCTVNGLVTVPVVCRLTGSILYCSSSAPGAFLLVQYKSIT